ncbi:SAM-dependent methyltransferase [Embleya sp. NPDC020630]|uniref:SAM-dependent methyltransferase n=1 Tax=Embleya sp. NPDC020630 TaxID=3363979 RepID=UPI0037A3A7C1
MSGLSVRMHATWRLRFVVRWHSRDRIVTAGQAITAVRAFYLGWPRHLHLVPAARRPGLSGALVELWQQGSSQRGGPPWRDFDSGARRQPVVPTHRPVAAKRGWFEDTPPRRTGPFLGRGSNPDHHRETVAMHAPASSIDLGLDRPHVARVNNYLAGGHANFALDRALADAALTVHPQLWTTVADATLFTRRAVTQLARIGVRQFVDIAQGIPIAGHTVHDAAHAVDADCRIVYVEDDPVVHALQSALTDDGTGRVTCVRAWPLAPESIWAHPRVRAMFDPAEPVAVVVGGFLQHLPYRYGPRGALHRLIAHLPAGSHVVATHLTGDTDPHSRANALARMYSSHGIPLRLRERRDVLTLLPGTPLEPGLVPAARWRALPKAAVTDTAAVTCHAAVVELRARLPLQRTGTTGPAVVLPPREEPR